jgi:hypothetical protein
MHDACEHFYLVLMGARFERRDGRKIHPPAGTGNARCDALIGDVEW